MKESLFIEKQIASKFMFVTMSFSWVFFPPAMQRKIDASATS